MGVKSTYSYIMPGDWYNYAGTQALAMAILLVKIMFAVLAVYACVRIYKMCRKYLKERRH